MAQAELQVTPEEARFLRSFYRRQTLPWLLGLGVLAIAAARWAVPAADPGLELRVGETAAAIEALRAQNAALHTELAALGQRVQPVLGRRLSDLEGRIAAVERRPSAAPDASGADLRVERLEERLGSATSAHDAIARSNLARLGDLEERMGALEGSPAATPAAPAP